MGKKTSDIKDGHDLKALSESCWGEAAVARAKAAVFAYNGEVSHDGQRFALRFFVSKCDGRPAMDGAAYEAWTPYRMACYGGDTPEQAIANMLHGVASLAHSGAIHPDRPGDKGAPNIQHALNVLTERLAWQTARREEAVRDLGDKGGMVAGPDTKTNLMPGLERNNQIIAALGTAVAALARVNDL